MKRRQCHEILQHACTDIRFDMHRTSHGTAHDMTRARAAPQAAAPADRSLRLRHRIIDHADMDARVGRRGALAARADWHVPARRAAAVRTGCWLCGSVVPSRSRLSRSVASRLMRSRAPRTTSSTGMAHTRITHTARTRSCVRRSLAHSLASARTENTHSASDPARTGLTSERAASSLVAQPCRGITEIGIDL